MDFIQTDYFTYHPANRFDGIVTDIPYKGAISHKLGEESFSIDAFLEKTNQDTQDNAFLITFCNFLCVADIMGWLNKQTNKQTWQYHCYGIWNKEPNRTWIAWSYPLRSVEFILFLKKGNFQYCFKDGSVQLPYHRSSFGGSLKETTPNDRKQSEGVYSEIFTFKNPKDKIHPTQKPTEFSKVFARITKSKEKYICDPFCGSGALLSAFSNAVGIDLEVWKK
jgi:DNA modification methylase